MTCLGSCRPYNCEEAVQTRLTAIEVSVADLVIKLKGLSSVAKECSPKVNNISPRKPLVTNESTKSVAITVKTPVDVVVSDLVVKGEPPSYYFR